MQITWQERLKTYFFFQPITMILMVANFMMVILTLISGGFNVNTLVNLGGLYPPLVTELGQYYRLITTAFLHGSILHFLVNSIALFYLGGHLERLIGSIRYTIIYFVTAIGSSVAVVLLKPDSVTIGASGAIYGIIGALLLLTFTRKEWFHTQTIRSIRNLIFINIIFTLLIPSVSTEGHFGGLIVGFILIQLITPHTPVLQEKIEKLKRDQNDPWVN